MSDIGIGETPGWEGRLADLLCLHMGIHGFPPRVDEDIWDIVLNWGTGTGKRIGIKVHKGDYSAQVFAFCGSSSPYSSPATRMMEVGDIRTEEGLRTLLQYFSEVSSAVFGG